MEVFSSMHALRHVLHFFADLIYPPRCPLCDAFVSIRHGLCAPCDAQLVRVAGEASIELPTALWFRRARSCFAFEGRLKDAIHAYKYAGRLDLAGFFAVSLAEVVAGMGEIDAIVSVPPDTARLRRRGFDPCALTARKASRMAGVRYLPVALMRTRRVEAQVGLARTERQTNVRGVFAVARKALSAVDGGRILVLDDVLTTGATVNDCARALMKAGAAGVQVLTIARTL